MGADFEKAHPKFGRGERIRTSDLSVPNRAHYQAVLRPESYDKSRFKKKKRYILASGGISGQVSQVLMRLFQRPMSVTDLILNFWGQFREGHFGVGWNENGIISESTCSSRLEADSTFAYSHAYI